MTTSVSLTDEELAVLDQKCRQEIQEKVDLALARIIAAKNLPDLSTEEAGLVSDIVKLAEKEKRISYLGRSICFCHVCKKDAGYKKHARDGRYHRKGQPDYSKPLHFS